MGVVYTRNVKSLYESQKNLVSSLLKASFVLGNCDKSISTPFMSVSLPSGVTIPMLLISDLAML